MSYVRGPYGLEYQPRRASEGHHCLPWAVGGLIVLAIAALAVYKFQHRKAPEPGTSPIVVAGDESGGNDKTTPQAVEGKLETGNGDSREPKQGSKVPSTTGKSQVESKPVVLPPPRPMPTVAPHIRPLVKKINESMELRPTADRPRLQKYIDAEEQEREDIAIEALKQLVRSPSLADLHNDFYHRWGDLNFRHLFSGKDTVWTTVITARKGDGKERIAREHRTTVAAVEQLNPSINWQKFRPGMPVRVLDFPSATLVISRDGTADLTLRKGESFFRRYDITVPATTKPGVYDISPADGATVYKRIRELGLGISRDARRELEMFLAPKSRIVVK